MDRRPSHLTEFGLFCLFLIFAWPAHSQDTWFRTLDLGGSDQLSIVEQLPGSGWILAGSIWDSPSGQMSSAVIKMDEAGQIAWVRRLYASEDRSLLSLKPTLDGGFIGAGYKGASGYGPSEPWVVKLDAAGVVIWENTYSRAYSLSISSIIQTADGGYLGTGSYRKNAGGPFSSAFLIKLDSLGAIAWTLTLGAMEDTLHATKVITTRDGGFLVAGDTAANCGPCGQPWIAKFNSSGSIQWQKLIQGPFAAQPLSAMELQEGGTLLSGYSSNYEPGQPSGAWVLKLGAAGQVVWSKVFDTPSTFPGGIAEVPTSHEILISGGLGPPLARESQGTWLACLNSEGSILWQRGYGGYSGDGLGAMLPTYDGHLFVVGAGWLDSTSSTDIWLLKTHLDGTLDEPCSVPVPAEATALDGILTAVDASYAASWLAVQAASVQSNSSVIQPVLSDLCPCSLDCSAFASPSSGVVPFIVQFSSSATVQGLCGEEVAFHWDFGDGAFSAEHNPVHTYLVPGTQHWNLTVYVGSAVCSRSGSVLVNPFDLSFYDDMSRCRVCVNSVTGAWSWQVLYGPGAGVYNGIGRVSWQNGVLFLVSQPGEPWRLSLKHYRNQNKASGSFTYPSKRFTSVLVDNNTLNNPPGCQESGIQPYAF